MIIYSRFTLLDARHKLERLYPAKEPSLDELSESKNNLGASLDCPLSYPPILVDNRVMDFIQSNALLITENLYPQK